MSLYTLSSNIFGSMRIKRKSFGENLYKMLANRVLIMKSGTIVEEGIATKILTEPKNKYTKALVNASPMVPDHWLTRG